MQDELRVLCTLGFSFLFMVSASLVFWKLTGMISNIGSRGRMVLQDTVEDAAGTLTMLIINSGALTGLP